MNFGTKLQLLSLFPPKTFVFTIWSVGRKFHLQKVGVAAVFLLTKMMSKFDFWHSLDKRWKVEFGFPKSIVKILHLYFLWILSELESYDANVYFFNYRFWDWNQTPIPFTFFAKKFLKLNLDTTFINKINAATPTFC